MLKNIDKLSTKERTEICSKYLNWNADDTCKGCPLQIDTIHCYNGVVEELGDVKSKLEDLEKLLHKVKDKEIEVD